MSGRVRTIAVVACAGAAALALFAASRTWAVGVVPRPLPLPPVRQARTGGDLAPWLTALGLVGLAGAGALLATRGAVRSALGGLLVLCGGGIAAAGTPLGTAESDLTGQGRALAGVCVVAGCVVAAVGVLTIVKGAAWPALGSRFERAGASGTRPGQARSEEAGPSGGGGPRPAVPGPPAPATGAARPVTAAMWDALDRGEDPTATDDQLGRDAK